MPTTQRWWGHVICTLFAHWFICCVFLCTLTFINILIEVAESLTLRRLMNCLRCLRELKALADMFGPKPSVLSVNVPCWECGLPSLSNELLLFIKSHVCYPQPLLCTAARACVFFLRYHLRLTPIYALPFTGESHWCSFSSRRVAGVICVRPIISPALKTFLSLLQVGMKN